MFRFASAGLAGFLLAAPAIALAQSELDKAVAANKEGAVVISCAVNASGGVDNCSILSEDPKGYGFGEAALKLSEKFRMQPKFSKKPMPGGTVRIPMKFKLPDKPLPPATGSDDVRGSVRILPAP